MAAQKLNWNNKQVYDKTITQLHNYIKTITDSLTMHKKEMIFKTELSLHITKGTFLQTKNCKLFKSRLAGKR